MHGGFQRSVSQEQFRKYIESKICYKHIFTLICKIEKNYSEIKSCIAKISRNYLYIKCTIYFYYFFPVILITVVAYFLFYVDVLKTLSTLFKIHIVFNKMQMMSCSGAVDSTLAW